MTAREAMSRPLKHTSKQLRWIVLGGAATWWTGAPQHIKGLLLLPGYVSLVAWVGLSLGVATISLFLYLMISPWMRGRRLDFGRWSESNELKSVIPILTATIVCGWTLLVSSLTYWTSLGLIKSFIGASGLYILSFGLLGLIPVPPPL